MNQTQDKDDFTNSQRNIFLIVSLVIFILQILVQISMRPSEGEDSAFILFPAMFGLSLTLAVATLHFKYDYQPSIPYGIFLAIIEVIVVGIATEFFAGFWSFLFFSIYITLAYFTQLWVFESHPLKAIHYGVMIVFFILALLFGILFCLFEYVMCAICVVLLILAFITRKTPVDIILIIFIK